MNKTTKNIGLLLLGFLFFINLLQAQEGCFNIGHINDNSTGNSIIKTDDGGFFITGYTSDPELSDSATDLYCVRLDDEGKLIWARSVGGESWDYGFSGIQTSDGGFLAVGATQSYGTFVHDVYVVRFNADGDILWTQVIDGAGDDRNDRAHSVVETYDGGFAIAGYSYVEGGWYQNAWVIKLDNSGNIVWTRMVGGNSGDVAEDIIETNDQGLLVVGGTASYGPGRSSVYVFKLDESGDLLWTRTIGGEKDDYAYGVAETPDGDFVVVGLTHSYGAGLAGDLDASDAYIIKFNAEGDSLWTRTVGGFNYERLDDVIITSDGYILAAGETMTFGGSNMDAYVIKMDMQGDVLWTCALGSNGVHMAFSLVEVEPEKYIVTGRTHHSSYSRDIFVAWFDDECISCCKVGSGGEINSGGVLGTGGAAGLGGESLGSGGEIDAFFYLDTLCLNTTTAAYMHELQSLLKVTPNPTDDILYIEFPDYKNAKAVIFDSEGKVVKSFYLQGMITQTSIGHLAGGFYIVKIITNNGIASRKIIKR